MTIQVNAQTIRRGLVSLMLPAYDAAWETYRFRCINHEYPTCTGRSSGVPCRHEAARLRSELRLERVVADVMEVAA